MELIKSGLSGMHGKNYIHHTYSFLGDLLLPVSWGQIEAPPPLETPRTLQTYGIERFKVALNGPTLCRETPVSRTANVISPVCMFNYLLV